MLFGILLKCLNTRSLLLRVNSGGRLPGTRPVLVVVEAIKADGEGVTATEVEHLLELLLLSLILSVEPRPGLPVLHDLEKF